MSSIEGATQLLEEALLQDDEESKQYTRDGSVDYRGRPAIKKDTGNWRACPFILGNECCERLAFFGIATNLVTYLTTKLHEGNVSAARNVSIWLGTSYLTPLIGAVLGDGYWGRYWTIAVFSVVYFIGMCTLTLSASLPALKPAECLGSVCPSATPAQYAVFYFGLYVIALGIGGIKSCVPSFGAGQFDDTDPKERVKKGSFFNWYYFSINLGAIVSCSIVVWIQDNAGWGLGFGIPTLFMVLSVDFLHQIPQYFLLGAAEVFAFVGLLQFFYDQSPDAMKTLGGKLGWIPDNLNKGHLDYFFLLLAGLSFLNMLVYIVAAKRYKQTKTS